MNRNAKIVDEKYLAWARRRWCTVGTGCAGPIDRDHIKARGFGSGKRNDYLILEFCRLHHTEREQIGDEKFQEQYRINLYEEVAWQLIEYLLESRASRSSS